MYIKINPGRLVAQATKFRMAASNIQRNSAGFPPPRIHKCIPVHMNPTESAT